MTVSRSPTREELRCTICHAPGPVPIDHIREKGMGGSAERDVPENKIPLCPTCHDLKSLKRIKTWAKQLNMDTWVYHWQRVGSDVVIRVPVRIDERHGCLVPAGEEVMPDAARDRLSVSSVFHVQQASREVGGREASLVPSDAAEPTDASGPELVEGSASSPGAEGEEDSKGQPADAEPSAPTGPVSAAITGGVGGTQGLVAGGEDAVLEQGASGPPASLMVGEGEASQFLVVTPPSVDTPRVNAAAPRPSPSPTSLTWEDWCEYGRCLRDQGELLQGTLTQWCFAVGDWIIEGEDTFGEMAHQLIDDIGLTYWKVATYASVARRVPPENRLCDVPRITFSHHQAVAALPAPEQRERLAQAASGGMTVRELRGAVSGPVVALETHACPECGAEHRRNPAELKR